MKVTSLIEEKNHESMLQRQFAHDVFLGLSSFPKKIPSKYFYDDKGSNIFQQITRLPEYYPTRTEYEILEDIKELLPDLIGKGEIDIVELGVGDGHKTKLIIESFLNKKIKVNFYPIDISHHALHLLEQNLIQHPALFVHGIVAEYIQGLRFARKDSTNRQIVLFLGSNIGNFNRDEEDAILGEIKSSMHEDDFLLIGFDLKKNIDVMTRAYSDKEGVTAKFNFNLLERINSELGGNFLLSNFSHEAFYNPELGAMESFLISLKDQSVYIEALDEYFHFDEFEPIHMEYSFKYLEKEIDQLSVQNGFKTIVKFKDAQKFFVDALWQV